MSSCSLIVFCELNLNLTFYGLFAFGFWFINFGFTHNSSIGAGFKPGICEGIGGRLTGESDRLIVSLNDNSSSSSSSESESSLHLGGGGDIISQS